MLKPSIAYAVLQRCNAFGDYHALASSVVDKLLDEADAFKYRKPKNANGSRARCFHAYLVRRAESLTGLAREACEGRSSIVTMKRGRRSVTVSSY